MIGSFSLSGLEAELAGKLRGEDVTFSAVSTDTRTIKPGDLFVALRGEKFDGDNFVAEAQAKGACAALVGHFSESELPQLYVADTTRALGLLGRLNRQRSTACLLAITGSQGKTTVKEMTGRILAQAGNTLITGGNLNNVIGVPLTLLRLDAEHQYGVMELGANQIGEIAWTVSLVQPQVAVITNATPTHLEGFGTLDGVVRGKGEILQGLGSDGVAVLNRDDPHFSWWRDRCVGRRMVSVSINDSSTDYYSEDMRLGNGPQDMRFQLVTPSGSATVSLALPGRHNMANAVIAAAAAMEAGADLAQVVKGLQDMRSVKGRMCVMAGYHGSRLIDDTYNASPSSFKAAIDVLCAYPGLRVLVAGDMAELGERGGAMHSEVGQRASAAGVDRLLTLGVQSRLSTDAFGAGATHYASLPALVSDCKALMDVGTTVLVKGSRSANMDRVVDQLKIQEAGKC